jgi:hypothetical protein
MSRALKNCDFRSDRLFAFDEQHVEFYPISGERDYFRGLLSNPEFARDNPFLRLSLARVVSDSAIIIDEMYRCVASLRKYAKEEFINAWYKTERVDLLEKIDPLYHQRLPPTWQVLLRIEELRRPSVFRPTPGFFGSSSSHAVGGMGAGAAMSAALVAVAVFDTRSRAELAYAALLRRDYEPSDINLVLLQEAFDSMFPEFRTADAQSLADSKGLTQLLVNRQYVPFEDSAIVCAGPYANNLIRSMETGASSSKRLADSGMPNDRGQLYLERIRDGGILMTVGSIPPSEVSFFEREWSNE